MNEKIERLIQLNPAYEGTPLAVWARENESEFLCKLSDLRQDFPNKLIIATDYLFSASSYTYQEVLEKISLDQIQGKRIDRRGSMQGGFPWTDDSRPWPFFDDGKPIRPSIQLNLKQIGKALELQLPEVIYQYWGDEVGGTRIIPLEEIEGKEPDWSYPDFSLGSDLIWPDDHGWIFEPESESGQIEWVGNTISVGRKIFEMPDMALFFRDADSDDPEICRDISLWLQANDVLYSVAEFISERLATSERGYPSRRDDCYVEFCKSGKTLRKGNTWSFLQKDCDLPGDRKYHDLVMTGISCLYNPGSLEEKDPLQFWDARLIVLAKIPNSPLSSGLNGDEIEIGEVYSEWNRTGREYFHCI